MEKNKKRLRKRRLIIILFPLLMVFLLPMPLWAQTGHIVKGRVTDTKGAPMPGVTLKLESTAIGVASDNEGNFTIVVPVQQGNLIVSFVGFKTQKVPFTAQRTLAIKMSEESTALDEVQVVAYGQASKREITGSISTVKGDALKDNATSDLVAKLQGQIPGVNIVTTSGAPGAQGAITIRGFNSLSIESGRIGSDPLWVVDGVPLYSTPDNTSGVTPISTIPASDIERIDVLKDASACSLYGSRAANGVILVTTRSGRFNQGFKVTANYTQSFSFRSALPTITVGNAERRFRLEAFRNYEEAVYDYETNSQHYVGSAEESEETGLHKDYFWNKGLGRTIAYLQDSLSYNNDYSLYKYFFQTRKVSDASISFSGGSSTMSYYIGAGYYKETGAVVKTGFNRQYLNGTFIFQPIPKFDGRLSFSFTRTGLERVNKDFDAYNGEPQPGANIPRIPSLITGYTSLAIEEGSEAFKYLFQTYDYLREDNDTYRFRTNLNLGYELLPGLSVKTSLAFDYFGKLRNSFIPSTYDEYRQNYSSGQVERNISGLNEDFITYDRSFGEKHRVKAMAGISFQLDQFNGIAGYGRDTGNDLIYFMGTTGSATDMATLRQMKEYNSDKSKSSLVSAFARLSYSYMDKYFAEATFRRDGSSRFGRNVRWGSFPSCSVGYVFTAESFMQDIRHILPNGKLRFSWGKTGKQFESPYLAQGVYGPGVFTFQGQPTMKTVDLPNPGLTWEQTDQYDVGLDLDFFNYRLGLTADWYYRYTDNLLYPVSLPGDYTGFPVQIQNACAVSNSGIELMLKADIIRNDKVTWNVSVNIARNWNRLEKSPGNRTLFNPLSSSNVSVVGKELNRIYVLDDRKGFYRGQDEVPYFYIDGEKRYLGLYNQYYREGNRIIQDVDKNGIISNIAGVQDDRIDAGSPLPKAYGGINMSLAFKNFDVNISMPFSLGRHILYDAVSYLATTPDSKAPILADLNDYTFWHEGAAHFNMPRNSMVGELADFSSGLYSNVHKVNSLRIRLISIGYTFPEDMVRFARIRVFASGENLHVFKGKFPGKDPDMTDPITGLYGLDIYPNSKTFNFGLQITLGK